MRNGSRNTEAPHFYHLPIAAYVTLQNTRDHLRMTVKWVVEVGVPERCGPGSRPSPG